MVRQVRGLGTLVPEEIRWLPANTEGSVEKILVYPGTKVEADTVILELTSPELEQTASDAVSKAKAAEAELTSLRATLQREYLDQEATTARVHSEYEQAKMERQTNDQLNKNGLVAELVYKTSKVKEAELANSRRDRTETTDLRENFDRAAAGLEAGGRRPGQSAGQVENGPGGSVARESRHVGRAATVAGANRPASEDRR